MNKIKHDCKNHNHKKPFKYKKEVREYIVTNTKKTGGYKISTPYQCNICQYWFIQTKGNKIKNDNKRKQVKKIIDDENRRITNEYGQLIKGNNRAVIRRGKILVSDDVLKERSRIAQQIEDKKNKIIKTKNAKKKNTLFIFCLVSLLLGIAGHPFFIIVSLFLFILWSDFKKI
ncbi:MAG: hypothetical protein H8E84_07290 [Flavobacteriales bacterium]|nr:hypothetical protein [Flavobacteriales bacterium]